VLADRRCRRPAFDVRITNLQTPSYCSICLRGSKTLRLNASSTLIGCTVDSVPGCVDDDVSDDSDVTVCDVTVLFLFFLSALLDSVALATSPRPAATIHRTSATYYSPVSQYTHLYHNILTCITVLQYSPVSQYTHLHHNTHLYHILLTCITILTCITMCIATSSNELSG